MVGIFLQNLSSPFRKRCNASDLVVKCNSKLYKVVKNTIAFVVNVRISSISRTVMPFQDYDDLIKHFCHVEVMEAHKRT